MIVGLGGHLHFTIPALMVGSCKINALAAAPAPALAPAPAPALAADPAPAPAPHLPDSESSLKLDQSPLKLPHVVEGLSFRHYRLDTTNMYGQNKDQDPR